MKARIALNGLLAACAIFCFGLAFWKFYPITIDDAFITFAHTKHAAKGEGFVFNIGEYVEATSSFLWALILIPFEWLSIGSPIGAKVLSVFSVASLVWLTIALFKKIQRTLDISTLAISPAAGAVACIFLSAAFLHWTNQGMENPLVALLIVWTLYSFYTEFVERRQGHSYIPLILLEASRPEGFAFVGVFAGTRVLLGLYRGKSWTGFWLLKLLSGIAVYEAFGLWYYGKLMPNTVGAKVGGLDAVTIKAGTDYLLLPSTAQAWALGLAALPYLAVIFVTAITSRNARQAAYPTLFSLLLPLLAMAFMQIAFIVGAGGDWMPGSRFISHIVPVYSILLFACWQISVKLWEIAWPRQLVLRRLYSSTIVLVVAIYASYFSQIFYRDFPVLKWINDSSENAISPIVDYINRNGSSHDIIACSDVGRIGYYYVGPVFDWWGLASPEVVRRGEQLGKIKAETVLEVKPKFVILYSAESELTPEKGIGGFGGMSIPFMQSAEFMRDYFPALSTKFTDGRHHVLFQRK